MNNEELIAKFLETHNEYRPRKDYLLVDSDGYLIICVFNSCLMIHFNAWLSEKFTNDRRLVLLHCTTRLVDYIKKYSSHMRKVHKKPIKCYAFKKDKCVLDTKDDKYSLDECTFWVSEESKAKVLRLHTQLNYVIDEEDNRLTEGIFPINVFNIINECSKLYSTDIKIHKNGDIYDFRQKEKKLYGKENY